MIHLTVFKASFRKIPVWIRISNVFTVGMWEVLIAISSGFPWWLSGKESACNAGDLGMIPWVGKIPWRRKRQPTSVFLPGKSHGQRSQADHSPWGHKELDTVEWLITHTLLCMGGLTCCPTPTPFWVPDSEFSGHSQQDRTSNVNSFTINENFTLRKSQHNF